MQSSHCEFLSAAQAPVDRWVTLEAHLRVSSCPSCGGHEREPVAPGYWRCTTVLAERIPTGAPPSGRFGPPFIQNSFRCGREYAEGSNAMTPSCAYCTTDSIGSCGQCGKRICGDCSGRYSDQRLCVVCIGQRNVEAEAHRQRGLAAQKSQEEEGHANLLAERRRAYGNEADIKRRISDLQVSPDWRRKRRNGPIDSVHSASSWVLWILLFQIPTWVTYNLVFKHQHPAHIVGLIWFLSWIVLMVLIIQSWRASIRASDLRQSRLHAEATELRNQLGCGDQHCQQCNVSS
jgi:hypothetical protein